jgi:O-antigen/teichoic acid export membrane protein
VDTQRNVKPERSLTVRLATNTIVQAAGILGSAAIGFFTFVAVTRGLGPEAFGDFTAAMVFLFIPVVLADIGFSTAVLREISASPTRTEAAMRASLPFRAFVSSGVVTLAAAIGVVLPLNDRTTVAILIGAAGSFLTLMTLALLPVLQAQLRMHWAVAGNVTGRLVTLGLTLAALAVGLGFKSIVVAQVVGIAVTFAVHLFAVGRTVRLTPVVDPQYWRSLVAGSLVIGLAIGLSQIYFRIDTVLLALFRSSEEVGLYGAAYKFIELAQFMAAAVAVSMFPPLASFVARGDPRASDLMQKSFDVLLAGAVFLFVLMLAFPEEIITVSAGPDYRGAATALQLLAPYVLFGFVNAVLWRALLAAERDRMLLVTALAVLALNVALNLALIPAYGYKAAAVVSVVSEAAILLPIAWAVRQEGLLPTLRYAPLVVLAGAAMALVAWLVPGPALVAGTLASGIFAAILLAAPGTVNEVARSLLPALRRRSATT